MVPAVRGGHAGAGVVDADLAGVGGGGLAVDEDHGPAGAAGDDAVKARRRGWRGVGLRGAVDAGAFGWGVEQPAEGFRAGGEARYLSAFNRTLEVANNASSQVRVAYEGYRSAYDLARHYRSEVVPLRQNITEESVLQYNGMLIGVFELLAAARAQSASVVQAIEAERDFWRAEAALKASLLGQPIAPISLQSSASPAEAGGGH